MKTSTTVALTAALAAVGLMAAFHLQQVGAARREALIAQRAVGEQLAPAGPRFVLAGLQEPLQDLPPSSPPVAAETLPPMPPQEGASPFETDDLKPPSSDVASPTPLPSPNPTPAPSIDPFVDPHAPPPSAPGTPSPVASPPAQAPIPPPADLAPPTAPPTSVLEPMPATPRPSRTPPSPAVDGALPAPDDLDAPPTSDVRDTPRPAFVRRAPDQRAPMARQARPATAPANAPGLREPRPVASDMLLPTPSPVVIAPFIPPPARRTNADGYFRSPVELDGASRPRTQSEQELGTHAQEMSRALAQLRSGPTSTEGSSQASQLDAQLRDLVARQFDIRQKRYDDEIQALEDRVQKLKALVGRRQESRSEIVEKRINQLLSEAQGLGW